MVDFCQHNHTIGDNYGVSCTECGKQLWGYGYGGWFGSNLTGKEKCIHKFVMSIGELEDICLYCKRLQSEVEDEI